MKRILHIVLLVLAVVPAVAQVDFFNLGSEITITSNTTLHINGDLINGAETGSGFANEGEIHVTGDIQNNATNNLFLTNAGKVRLYGDTTQELLGDSSIVFHKLTIDKPGGEVNLGHTIYVNDSLALEDGNIFLGPNDIELSNNGFLVGEDVSSYVYGENGRIFATQTLNGNTGNIAGLGLEFQFADILGNTRITRGHTSQSGASTGSILRYYTLDVSSPGATIDDVKIDYIDPYEVNGLDEAKFSLWYSENGGIVWERQSSLPNIGLDAVEGTNVETTSSSLLFTIAESTCTKVPAVDLGADTVYLCIGDTVTIDAENPGLTYQWSTGDSTQTIDVSTGATYEVIVIDANGCAGRDSMTLIEKPFPVLEFELTNVCQKELSLFTNTSTISQDTMSFFWNFGDANTTEDTTSIASPSYEYDTAGLYTVRLTAESTFGCRDTVEKSYRVHPLPIAQLDLTHVCLNGGNEFTNMSSVASPVDGQSYAVNYTRWDFGDGAVLSDTSLLANPTYAYPAEGQYIVELQVETNAGCRDTVSGSVDVYPRATIDFNLNNVCKGGDIGVVNNSTISSGTLSYAWDFGDGLGSSLEQPTKVYQSAGDYNVKVIATSDFDCADSLTQSVTIYEIPVADFVVNDTCSSNQITLENRSSIATGVDLSYEWAFDDNTTDNVETPTKTYALEGSYDIDLKVTSQFGCVDSTSVETTIFPSPTADFTFTNDCQGESISFLNTSTVSSGGLSYFWDFDLGAVTSSLKSPIQQFSDAGDYTIHLTVETSNGCSDTLSQVLTMYALPTIDLSPIISTCAGTYTLSPGPQEAGTQYLWSDLSTDTSLTVTSSGTYSIEVVDPRNCSNKLFTDVSLNSVFAPSLGDDTSACDALVIDAGNAGSLSYLWSTGEDSRVIGVTTTDEYSVEIVDQNGCIGYDTIFVTINSSPIIDLGVDQDFCSGLNTTLDPGLAGMSYLWNTGDISQQIVTDTSGTFSVEVTTPEGCSSTDIVNVEVYDLPSIDLGEDQLVCDSITLDAGVAVSYLWSDGSTGQLLEVDAAGEFSVEITDGNACKNSDTIVVSIAPKPVVDLGDDIELCGDQTVILDAGLDGDSYMWSNNQSTQKIVIANTGRYSVVVTNSFSCSGYDTIDVTIQNFVDVDLGADQVLCLGQTADLDAGNVGSTYSWGSNVNFTSTDQQVSIQDSGTYWVEVTTPLGCIGSDTVTIAVSQEVVSADFLARSTLDVGDTVQFVNISNPDSIDYFWDFNDGITSTLEDPIHTFLQAGNYDVTLTVRNTFCSDQMTKEIIVNPLREEPEDDPISELFNTITLLDAYPNPTDGFLRIEVELELEDNLALYLYDLSGRIVEERSYEGDFIDDEIDLSYHSSGTYILKVIIPNDSKFVRLVKR